MLIKISGTVDNVNSWEGKNGFGGIVSISTVENKRRTAIEIPLQNKMQVDILEELLMDNVVVTVDLQSTKFGLRLGNVADISKVK